MVKAYVMTYNSNNERSKFELPKVSALSERLIQEWHSLFMTDTVFDETPDYLKQAVIFIDFENLDAEERAMYINFNEREAIRFAELDATIQDGIERDTVMVAQNLMNNGMSIEMIMQVTGLN